MLASSLPTKIQLPFAKNAGGSYIRTIPVASQIGIVAGEASFNDGFPPLNFLPDASGGINPDGRDMNGILNALSALLWWYSAGAPISYDSAFQTAIGGYPAGAIIQSAVVSGILWRSTTDNNATNPDTGGAGWINASPFTGLSNITMAGTSVTATLAQYGVQIINITGTLTANINLVLPNLAAKWIIENNTTGTFTITAKTAAGTGVVVVQGNSTSIFGDGTNIYKENTTIACLQYQTTSGTDGASTASGSFAVVPLTTSQYDGIGLSLASNQFTLPAGTYHIQAWAIHNPGGVGATGKLNLYNATSSTHLIQGLSGGPTGTGYDGTMTLLLDGVINVAVGQALELYEFANGVYARKAASSGQVEVYAAVTITKI